MFNLFLCALYTLNNIIVNFVPYICVLLIIVFVPYICYYNIIK
nr:MAG TPA: hypothetical protein [Bacteriophage sp.]